MTAPASENLHAEAVSFTYGARDVLKDVSMSVPRGALVGVLGPNGSGKTTLLRCLMGYLTPRSGAITLLGRDVARWPRRDFARQVAVVPQEMPTDFPLTVAELVLIGRVPHLAPRGLGFESDADRAAAAAAIEACGLGELRERPLHQLSGGELRRAFIARALAQDTPFLLLDEPTSSLDLKQQLAILDLLRERARAGRGVLVVLHDVNLAAAHCDSIVLMNEGAVAASGPPNAALDPEILGNVYGVDLRAVAATGLDRVLLVPTLRRSRPE
ncbi:MAG TPA: ABC transporter ATP-binding protein [Polyangia bacterium]|jgi:iron complex transport system ATP-binding protein